ncbi:FIST signal transduction protein [Yoonia maritima]|uniref:FIST signal transduction protein n=1 Tax=Yoonia maritima TaxID=1435347 RepID=UPI000D1016A1|nr:FIST N-terminal domain-containing protein [Yoonia maritima]
MLKVVIGWSDEPDTGEATKFALDMAVASLDGQSAQAAMVYAGVDFDLDVVAKEINARFPELLVVGCTTDGEIAGGEGFLEDSLVITLFASDSIQFTVGIGRNAIADPLTAAKDAVAMAQSSSEIAPSLCISLLEGLGTNIHHLVEGIRSAVGADVPVVGGAAGDQLRFEGTRQMCGDVVTSDAVVVLMLHGPLVISTGVSTGYTPLGQSHPVTKADGPVVHQIDHRPAADLYADYLQQPSIFYPLAVQDETRQSLVLSSPLNFDADTGAIHMVNPVAQDSMVQLATASREEIVDAARNSVGQAFAGFGEGKVDAALLFSCAGRRATLGTRTGEEYAAIKNVIGENVPTAGFYCYGEIAPDFNGGQPLTHTNAFVAVLLGTP